MTLDQRTQSNRGFSGQLNIEQYGRWNSLGNLNRLILSPYRICLREVLS